MLATSLCFSCRKVDQAQESRNLSDDKRQLRQVLKIRVLGLATVQRAGRRQTSRIQWLKEGDACTRFFYLRANGRRRRKHIAHLLRPDNTFIWKHEEKEEALHQYYNSLLGTNVPREMTFDWERLQLPQIQAAGLDLPFTEAEIEAAVKELLAEKAPGPDGFTGTFYQSCWNIIKGDVCNAFNAICIQDNFIYVHNLA